MNFEVNWDTTMQQCLANAQAESELLIEYATQKLLEQEATAFINTYHTSCFAQAAEQLAYTDTLKEYHYTLYYYDQAGTLVQTVPPEGVKPLTPAQVDDFLAGNPSEPVHTLKTRYKYNSLNQLVWQQTPDAGTSEFWYDSQGQLRLSQNAQQVLDTAWSYTRYDAQGRIIEVGEMTTTAPLQDLLDSLDVADFPREANFTLTDITRTWYDSLDRDIQLLFPQENLRSRVAWVEVIDAGEDTLTTHYSYDAHGNVKALLQYVPGLGYKRTDYVYDLVSGNVNYVFYQYDAPDQFMQKYTYDADNRLTEVYTSTDGFLWDKEAHYFYYPHGPLARIELGEYRVQGLDYYYTLQGWLKGVNGTAENNDPGQDGLNGSKVGRDVMAFALGYHEGDYQGIGATPTTNQLWQRLDEQYSYQGLHNGNIAWMQTDLPGLEENPTQAMLYQYDQLNRLVLARSLTDYTEGSGFAARGSNPEAYDVSYTYDANGNLLTLQRYDHNVRLMDDFTYNYYPGTNRLMSVDDVVIDTTTYDEIVYNTNPLQSDGKVYRQITVQDDVTVGSGQSPLLQANELIHLKQNFHAQAGSGFHAKWVDEPNYETSTDSASFTYDAIGNLISDNNDSITWTPYGKPRSIVKEDGTIISFRYDGAGNRVEKKVVANDSSYVTRYIRDASGNVLAIYQDSMLIEQPIYGSSRLGMYRGGTETGERTLGHRNYELSNHLGNVLAVITDNVNMENDSVWATIVSLQDYYPFGLEMDGRSLNDANYRYGFNGKEKDDKGEFGSQTHYDYGFRIYNPKLGKFLSADPLTKSYPMLTPYQFASNTPIMAIDLDGLEAITRVHSPWYLSEMEKAFNAGDLERLTYLAAKASFAQRPKDIKESSYVKDSYGGHEYAGELDFGNHMGLKIQNKEGKTLYHIMRVDKDQGGMIRELFQLGGIPFTSEFASGDEPGPTIVAKYADEETNIGSLLIFANFSRFGIINTKGGVADIADRVANFISELRGYSSKENNSGVPEGEQKKRFDTISSEPTYWPGFINLQTGKAPYKGERHTIVDQETGDTTEVDEVITENPRLKSF